MKGRVSVERRAPPETEVSRIFASLDVALKAPEYALLAKDSVAMQTARTLAEQAIPTRTLGGNIKHSSAEFLKYLLVFQKVDNN